MGWQALPLPAANVPATRSPGMDPDDLVTRWFIAVQILSVYPGSRWQDSCISAIRQLP